MTLPLMLTSMHCWRLLTLLNIGCHSARGSRWSLPHLLWLADDAGRLKQLAHTKILLDKKDPNSKDVDGSVLPTLVYLAREKRPNYHHNFKAGATNATDKGIIKD
ncbi:hypothetical protein L6164_029521 [Bauhinia variegata]|uniref:Uncharacterized protein n=1 Tax=Bauhinia variegata TaxID=167791 RepID=A0ACB9L9K0_BAUVA|nr:hypothetical protein L6164_029521 [Bauhinia variegata]